MLAALLGVTEGVGCGDRQSTTLTTESERRSASLEVSGRRPVLWGDLVVHRGAGDGSPITLRSARLVDPVGPVRLQTAYVAGPARTFERIFAWDEGDFEANSELRPRRDWHPLAGYQLPRSLGPYGSIELVLRLAPPGRGQLRIGGVRLSYRSGGETRELTLPNRLAACAPPPCRPPEARG